jgi:hypothetical protein
VIRELQLAWRKGSFRVRVFSYTIALLGAVTLGWAALSVGDFVESLSLSEGVAFLSVVAVACVSARWVVRVPRTDNYMAVADSLMLAVTMIYGVVAGVLANGLFYLVSYWFVTRSSPKDSRDNHAWDHGQAAFNVGAGALYALLCATVFFATLPDGPIGARQLIIPVVLMAGMQMRARRNSGMDRNNESTLRLGSACLPAVCSRRRRPVPPV